MLDWWWGEHGLSTMAGCVSTLEMGHRALGRADEHPLGLLSNYSSKWARRAARLGWAHQGDDGRREGAEKWKVRGPRIWVALEINGAGWNRTPKSECRARWWHELHPQAAIRGREVPVISEFRGSEGSPDLITASGLSWCREWPQREAAAS